MFYLYLTIFILLIAGGAYLYIKTLLKTIEKQKKEIAEKDITIVNLSNKIVVLAKNEENLKQREAELVFTVQKLEGAKTDEEKDKVVSDSIGNFFKR